MLVGEFLESRRSGCIDWGWREGVYMLTNTVNNKRYIGRSVDVINRINAHFTGRGNGDVYHDYRLGDTFTVRYYPYDPNQFQTLNEMEYHLIRIYETNICGYNRQEGSKR